MIDVKLMIFRIDIFTPLIVWCVIFLKQIMHKEIEWKEEKKYWKQQIMK